MAAALAVAAPGCVLAAQQAAPNQAPAPPFSIAPEAPKSDQSAQQGKRNSDQSLAQRLSESNGTIHPPPVDPGMNKVPPQTGTMPIVKPPPNVQSK
ncbi:MAG TPA: hypothetical protein VLI93_02860 [Acetobacteraceae bacterium]|nr:hypothetical protein [Acetobacteraceae bacterium]